MKHIQVHLLIVTSDIMIQLKQPFFRIHSKILQNSGCLISFILNTRWDNIILLNTYNQKELYYVIDGKFKKKNYLL